MSLSKNKIKFIHSLEIKKIRKQENLFIAEGPKLVGDLLGKFPCKLIVALPEWLEQHSSLQAEEVEKVSLDDLTRASLLKTPQQVVALFQQPCFEWNMSDVAGQLCLALDDVQDPGNLGTIVRLADWFGIEHIFCSPGTADIFNPKAMQATMGGVAHVQLHYTPLPDLVRSLSPVPVYGTFLEGDNIYGQELTTNGLIVMGNEGNGIGEAMKQCVTRKLYVPNYPPTRDTTESLNVAIATAVVCAEFRRQHALR